MKSGEPAEEETLPAEEVSGAPAEQQEATEEERVDVHDPLETRGREMKPTLDRRQRDVDDRRVEHDHELRNADQNEDEPAVHRSTHKQPSFLNELKNPLTVAEAD